MRNTVQKSIIKDAIFELMHPTADGIYSKVVETHSEISLATVYRNIKLMVESGELVKLCTPDCEAVYENKMDGHYHLKCSKCGMVVDLPNSYCKEIDEHFRGSHNELKISNHNILFNGLCENCKKGEI